MKTSFSGSALLAYAELDVQKFMMLNNLGKHKGKGGPLFIPQKVLISSCVTGSGLGQIVSLLT